MTYKKKKNKDHLKVVSTNGADTSPPPPEMTYDDALVDVYAHAFEVLTDHPNIELGMSCLWQIREAIAAALDPLSNVDVALFKEYGFETD